MPTATLIYNPRAGRLTISSALEAVARSWRAGGWTVIARPTSGPGDASRLARLAADAGEEVVLAAGGDGTLGEVADGLAGSQTILAPIPAGTANALAQELVLPRPQILEPHSMVKAANTLLHGRVQTIDLGLTSTPTGNRHWILWSGVGADAFLVQHLEPRPTWSKRLGAVGYSLQAATLLHQLPAMRAVVEIDGNRVEDDFLMILISNARRYAGGLISLNSDGLLDDEMLEVWLFRAGVPAENLPQGERLVKMASYMAAAKLGMQDLAPGMTLIPGRQVSIQTEPMMHCHTDGEPVGATPITCEIRPKALRLLVPTDTPEDLFLEPGTPFSEAI
ncbi:MAG: diacylglycerol kinase family lipid kinase [Chloroflexota bacterium]